MSGEEWREDARQVAEAIKARIVVGWHSVLSPPIPGCPCSECLEAWK